MKQNRISPNETYPSVHTSTWTISTPMSSVTNNDEDLPSYNKFIDSLDIFPPNYFNISIVPNRAVLHYSEMIPFNETSKAKIKRKKSSVFSFDSLIDKNPDQLWLYFTTYLKEKPSPFVNISGYHTEFYPTIESYRTTNGQYRTRSVTRTRVVIDFNYSIDLTPYVSEHCWRIAVIPSKNTIDKNETISIRDALEEYTRSEKNMKEIQCQKQLTGWNFEELKYQIKDLISSTNYRGNISVNFSVDNQRIIARSSSKFNRFSNSIWTRIFCFLTCFWLIFAPIYFYLRTEGSIRHRIAADYNMISSTGIFLQMNTRLVINAAAIRSNKRFVAKTA